MYMYNRFPFFKIYKQFYEKLSQFNCLFVQFQDIILLVFSIQGIYDGQTKNTKAMSKCHTYIQKYIRWSVKKYEGKNQVSLMTSS